MRGFKPASKEEPATPREAGARRPEWLRYCQAAFLAAFLAARAAASARSSSA